MRPSPRTFDVAQRSRRRLSLLLFTLLTLFYFLSFALMWLGVKLVLWAWLGRLLRWRVTSAPELLFVSLTALLVALTHWWDASRGGVRRILDSLGAAGPDPGDRYHRTLVNVAEEVKLAAGAAEDVRTVVIPSMAMNAFSVTGADGRSVIGVTEGLLSRLSRAQLQGVVAHEMAHIREGDNFLVTMSCSLFGVFAQILSGIKEAGEEDGRAFILYPLIWFISLGAQALNVLVSRQREYLADATAVELTRDPAALAEALWKLGRRWRGEGFIRDEMGGIFIVAPTGAGLGETEGFWADLFSTHPPMRRRVMTLLSMAHMGLGTLAARLEAAEEAEVPAQAPSAGEEAGPTRDAPFRAAAAGGRVCPVCGVPLVDREYEGMSIETCPACRGHLVPRGREYRILLREEERLSDQDRRRAREFVGNHPYRPKKGRSPAETPGIGPLVCPACGGPMRRQLYSYQYFVEVDRCAACRLSWFDGGDLEMLQAMVEEARAAGGAPPV